MTPEDRRRLFIALASRSEGTTANEAHEAALAQGDGVTVEAFHNLGRRLARAGRLTVHEHGPRKVYLAKPDPGDLWIDEDFLRSVIDPERPIESLTVVREATRQLRDVPAEAWAEAAKLLSEIPARQAAIEAIIAYRDDLADLLEEARRLRDESSDARELGQARRACEARIELLTSLCRDGLGLSREAINVPLTPEQGISALEKGLPPYDRDLLADELDRRIEDGPLVRVQPRPAENPRLLVAGADGSTRGGLMALDGTAGDFAFGPAPIITLNTAAAVINRQVRHGRNLVEAFLRLPEAPEDIQRAENRYTIMSQVFFPEMADGEYMHATWNAMDVLECRAALKALKRWTLPLGDVDVPPSDVVIRDGTIVPNDRDPAHYANPGSYGRIVREMVDLNWEMAQVCRDGDQTVAGAVKNAQIKVLAPIVNHILANRAGTPATSLTNWPVQLMNALSDQALLSRLLSGGMRPKGSWLRSALFMRPFHATAPAFSRHYSREPGDAPGRRIEKRIRDAWGTPDDERTNEQHGWAALREKNGYVQMLDNVWYAGCYLSPGVNLGKGQALPRLEILVPHSTQEQGDHPRRVLADHFCRLLTALTTTGFAVAQDHAMHDRTGVIDFVPTMLQRAHEIVNAFSKELKSRAEEYMDKFLAREVRTRRAFKVRIRPWTTKEMEEWRARLEGDRPGPPKLRLPRE